MIAIRPGRRASWRERADRRSDVLRGAALASCWSGWWRRPCSPRLAAHRDQPARRAPGAHRGLADGDRLGRPGIVWRTVVTDDQVAGFVARNRAGGEPDFTIRPPGRRPRYYVTQFSYPRIPSSSDLGADARAIPSVLATLERVRDTGRTTISNQATLPGDLDLPAPRRPVALELVVPLYRTELGQHAPVAERRRQFAGWAAGQFRAGDFLHAALSPRPRPLGFELHDEGVGPGSLVASEPKGGPAVPSSGRRRSPSGTGPLCCAMRPWPATRS